MGDARMEELTRDECFRLLAGQRVGRVVLVDDLGPVALPVGFAVDEHTVVFRSAEGTKLAVAGRRAGVAFEVDAFDEATRTGWSVLVRGEAVEVADTAGLDRARRLPLRSWAPGADRYVRILPSVLTGRRITLSDGGP